jgi:cell wall-associated NlpC family hydrolase
MKKLFLSFTIVTLLLAGCNIGKKDTVQENEETVDYKFPTKEEMNDMHNDLLTDPSVLSDDNLLIVGDRGLEKKLKQVQNSPNEYDNSMIQKMSSNGKMNDGLMKVTSSSNPYNLHQTFVNPKVKAINGSYINNVIGKGWDYYGTPYQLGSNRNNPTTFDCSDFTRWIHLFTLGMDLPQTSQTQWEYVKAFSKRKYTDINQVQKGDLVFFMNYKGWKPEDYKGINVKAQPVGHCGIYIGNGLVLHTASQKTGGVRFDKIKGNHLEYRFIGGGKVIQ